MLSILHLLNIFLVLHLGSRQALFLRGDETSLRNARSPKSRGRLSLYLKKQTPNEAGKGKNGRADPRRKKKVNKERNKKSCVLDAG